MTESNLPTLAESQGDICYSDEDYDKPYTPRPVEKHRKLINGYLCEVEIDTDSDPSTQGWMTSRDGHTASMESVLQLGYITSNSGDLDWSIEVPEEALERIEDWANSVGY